MTARWVAFCARHPWIVLAVTLLLATAGGLGERSLSEDVVPDLSDPQVAVVATWMGRSAVEVESGITRVLTTRLARVPGSTAARAVSMTGMAYVTVVFDAASDLEAGRRAIAERVALAREELPPGVRVDVGPAASSASWVFQYALVDRAQQIEPFALRRLQDDVLRPALAKVSGVAEVASLGGDSKQVRIELEAEPLEARGLAFSDIVGPVRAALDAPDAGVASLESLRIPRPGEPPVPLVEVASVAIDDAMPSAIADLGGTREAVGGIVLARPHADLMALVGAVKKTLSGERPRLPSTVDVVPVYDRTELAERSHLALLRALVEEVAAAVAVIVVFLASGRSALVPLVTLPVVLLLTFGAMWLLAVPATVMSLGGIGIALGLAVDADVVALEACHRRMEGAGALGREARRAQLVAAAQALAPAITTTLVITAVAFLPVFGFDGATGRLLRPLAVTKTLVIASAALVSLTFAPALRDRLVGHAVAPEFDNRLTRALVDLYRPVVHFALERPALTLATAALAVASCLPVATRLGGEFLPAIDEGDLLFMPTTLPGVSPEHAAAEMRRQDRAIAAFPEVDTVFGKVGRADTATDPAPFEMAETLVRLKPRARWPVARTTADLVAALDRATRRPGWTSAWTAPARARMQMMSTGIRTPVGIRVVATDPARLSELGAALQAIAAREPGARSAAFEAPGGEPRLRFVPDADAMAAHHVDPARVAATADLVIAGGAMGDVAADGRRLAVSVTPTAAGLRGPADALRDVTVRSSDDPGGEPVPLALLGRPAYESTPAAIRTEDGERVAYVYVDLDEGIDPVGWVERAQRSVDRAFDGGQVRLDAGERIEWAGQYRLFAAGKRRLVGIAVAVGIAIVGLLAIQFRSLAEALIVALAVPFALVGSVWTLFLFGYPLSAPVWVGLLSVVGLATQTGVVMVVYIDESFHARLREGKIRDRADVIRAHAEGTVKRLRPKIMTVTTMAAALLPLVWSEDSGAEIMKRIAAPMLGGLATSAFLTLEVLPVVYTLWRCRQLRRARELGVPFERFAGNLPRWAPPVALPSTPASGHTAGSVTTP